MATQDVATALQRLEGVLRRRPSAGLSDDSAGVARWTGGTRVVADHPNGCRVATDVPPELGGQGREVTPGWLMRAGLASCTATTIVLAAAREGVELDELEVRATSRSDARGLFGMIEDGGTPVFSGLRDVRMHIRIAASGVSPERLRALVAASEDRSPMLASMRDALPVALDLEIGGE